MEIESTSRGCSAWRRAEDRHDRLRGHGVSGGINAAPVPQETGNRLALRVEVDLDGGELTVAIEGGASARIVRDGDGWRVETP